MDQYLLMMGFSMINGILWDIYIYMAMDQYLLIPFLMG